MENKVFEHVMLDLETMGNKSNSVIVSIGAVEFNIETGETGREFYQIIDMQSCLDQGLKINASTLKWWMQQIDEVRLELTKDGNHLAQVLGEFRFWLDECIENVKIWGNGARFDIGILEDAYVMCNYHEMPWGFRNEMDLRTLVAFAPEVKKQVLHNTDGPAHDPIFDCKVQIDYASQIWNKLKIND